MPSCPCTRTRLQHLACVCWCSSCAWGDNTCSCQIVAAGTNSASCPLWTMLAAACSARLLTSWAAGCSGCSGCSGCLLRLPWLLAELPCHIAPGCMSHSSRGGASSCCKTRRPRTQEDHKMRGAWKVTAFWFAVHLTTGESHDSGSSLLRAGTMDTLVLSSAGSTKRGKQHSRDNVHRVLLMSCAQHTHQANCCTQPTCSGLCE